MCTGILQGGKPTHNPCVGASGNCVFVHVVYGRYVEKHGLSILAGYMQFAARQWEAKPKKDMNGADVLKGEHSSIHG